MTESDRISPGFTVKRFHNSPAHPAGPHSFPAADGIGWTAWESSARTFASVDAATAFALATGCDRYGYEVVATGGAK
jgi:hypothetical protein